MNSRKFLSLLLLLVILLITVVKAEEKEGHSHTHHHHKSTTTSIVKSASTSISRSTSSVKHVKSVEEDEEDDGDDEETEHHKDEEKKDEKETQDQPEEPKVTTTTTTTTTSRTTTTTTTTTVSKTTTTTSTKVSTTTRTYTSSVVVNEPTTVSPTVVSVNEAQSVPISNAIAPEAQPAMNPIAPNNENTITSNRSSNVSADNNAPAKEESGSNNKVVKISVISIVAVGAVVGVATIGVHAYNRKSSDDREINMADIEAQPISYDFGKSNNDLSHMPVEECNPYNIMNENNRLYMNNNPYEFKPNLDNFETTPFDKVETAPNDQFRESIFSNNENAQPVQQLPYVQGLPVENGFIETPVANQIEVENYDMQNNQMPTLVPVEPEIIITKPDEEQANAQDGYKQIIPTVGKMEIIDTPDFNQMTTSMIEDHINNMDLENLASLNTEPQNQNQQEQEAGYKEIVPDIQEAVIENFDIEDDDQEQEFSAVDNITDTYRAALRATYCSTTDENRFSYRTVDSDHSLLHTMREEANW